MKRIIFLIPFFLIFFPKIVSASIGVGVGTGKIQVDDQLKPGTIYQLPPLMVINTGDEPSDYDVAIAYHEKQPELMPSKDWFIFTPQKFHLEPKGVQTVEIKLNLPLNATPGNYFAYLEGRPLKKSQSEGGASIGVAAAAKLYFTVVPSNIFTALYYKITSFWNVYAPWPQRASIALLVIFLLAIFKKFFNIEINIKSPSKDKKHDSSSETNNE